MFLNRLVNKLFTILQDIQHRAYVSTCIANGLKIGKRSIARPGVSFGSEPFLVSIGEDTRIASGVQFVTHSGATNNIRNLQGYEDIRNFGHIKIGNNCAIGSNAIILQNVEVGDNCFLGANSVLSESMPANTVYAGNPAKYICEIEDYADVLKKTTIPYPVELEKNRSELMRWLKQNLKEQYKPAE